MITKSPIMNYKGKLSPGDRLTYNSDYWEYIGPSPGNSRIGRWRTKTFPEGVSSGYDFGDFWKLEKCKSSNFNSLYEKLLG